MPSHLVAKILAEFRLEEDGALEIAGRAKLVECPARTLWPPGACRFP
jgi:hypothetical protein